MKAPAELTTSRLILRQPRPGDEEAIFERYASDPEVTRFLAWPRHRERSETERFLRFSDDEWDRWPAGPYLILSRSDGRLLAARA
jgi:RimJ/RimL family protein N-acetyltransferase